MNEMKEVILKIENLSKQYRLGNVGSGTISDDLKRFWYKIRGKEDPFLKIGESNDRTSKGKSDYVWALQNINFEVNQGEVIGIIGKNGAGKSTLLKILSKVTGPTTGSIKSNGRIASLLEVGTGFHPEMTGRENIYLNGAILGMTKKEIASKIEAIISFSGCERYIDTPTKRYSSGMTVRLAFAVAAHLEPDILIVDEVLAVGDAEFQKKAIGKMQDISKEGGRTVIFVSHNMAAVKSLCTRCIVLGNGTVDFIGNVEDAVNKYLRNNTDNNGVYFDNTASNQTSDILEVAIKNNAAELTEVFGFDDQIYLELKIKIAENHLPFAALGFNVKDQLERIVFTSENVLNESIKKAGEYCFKISLPKEILVPNDYRITLGLHIPNKELIRGFEDIVTFKIEETGSELNRYATSDYGCVILNCDWNLI